MQRETSYATSEGSETTPTPGEALHVLIAFGDVPAYKHALRLLVRIIHQLDEDVDLRPLPWQFSALEDPASRELALRDAERAVAVIVTASSEVSLPPSVQDWIQTCCRHREGGDPLLVGLLGGAETPPLSVAQSLALLRDAAARGGWTFLAPQAGGPGPQASRSLPSIS